MTAAASRSGFLPWLLGALALVAVLAWFYLAGREATGAGRRAVESPGPAAAVEQARDEPLAAEAAGEPEPVAESGQENDALEQYKEMNRYPAGTRRLTADSHDLLNPGARYERRHKLPGDENNPNLEWELQYTADRYFVRGGEPVGITLALWKGNEPVLPREVQMLAEAVDREGARKTVSLAAVTRGMAKAARFSPNDHWPGFAGQVRVTTDFSAEGLPTQSGALDFFFTGEERIPARFTGKITDQLSAGDLVLGVGLNVERAGVYRIEGSLYDASGSPFGWARFEGGLTPGPAVAALRYYGLLFHDAQAEGPYVLSGVHGHLLRPGNVPHREDMPPLETDYVTVNDYAMRDFNAEIRTGPKRQRMIEMYEDAVARGVRLTRPESAGGNEPPGGYQKNTKREKPCDHKEYKGPGCKRR